MEKIKVNCDYMSFSDEEKKQVIECLENHESSIFVGKTVENFEKKFADYLKAKYALAVPNCTLALYATFQSLGIRPNDEVIVPNLTHASSIYPIIMSGAKIKVCDFLPGTYNYDINHIKRLITSKTKFLLVCYLYGMPLNIEDIQELCHKNNIILIEDVAQAFGTKINNNYLGTFGTVGCFSFNDTKTLRIGEGGAIITNDIRIFQKIELFRHVGEVYKSNNYSSVSSNTTYGDLLFNGLTNKGKGLNLRPSPSIFSIGLVRLNNIQKFIGDRQQKLLLYSKELSSINGLNIIGNFSENNIEDYGPIAFWLVLDNKKFNRNKLMLGCINMGIPIGCFNYNTINNNDFFKNYVINKKDITSNSQYIRDNSVFLPLYDSLSISDVKKICIAFKSVVDNYDNDKIFKEELYEEQISYFDGFYLMR